MGFSARTRVNLSASPGLSENGKAGKNPKNRRQAEEKAGKIQEDGRWAIRFGHQ